MAVRLRLTRVGSRKNPIWRVVVADGRSKRDGRVLETVGRYNPQRQPSEIVLDRERIDHWVARGAQPSETVRKLIHASERGAPPAGASEEAARAEDGETAQEAGADSAAQSATVAEASSAEADAAAGDSDE